MWWPLFIAFVVGMNVGVWMNSPKGAEIGLRLGQWTRKHILRLPPVVKESLPFIPQGTYRYDGKVWRWISE